MICLQNKDVDFHFNKNVKFGSSFLICIDIRPVKNENCDLLEQLTKKVKFVDNLIQGEGKTYYKSGQLEYTLNYVDEVLQGEQR